MLEFFGGALFISVANNVFNTKLIQYINELKIPGVDALTLVQNGATALRRSVPAQYLQLVLDVYMDALQFAFRIALILACLSFLGAAGMERKRVKSEDTKEHDVRLGGGGYPNEGVPKPTKPQ